MRHKDKDKSQSDPQSSGRYAYDGLERVIHEKARLSIVSSLAAHSDGVTFNDLKELCALTDGNLSRHLQLLQEAGLIEVTKSFYQNRPQTVCYLTAQGRKRFLQYVVELEKVVADAVKAGDRRLPGKFSADIAPG